MALNMPISSNSATEMSAYGAAGAEPLHPGCTDRKRTTTQYPKQTQAPPTLPQYHSPP